MSVLTVTGLSQRFLDKVLYQDASFQVNIEKYLNQDFDWGLNTGCGEDYLATASSCRLFGPVGQFGAGTNSY